MTTKHSKLTIDQPFLLENGGVLPELELGYHTYGWAPGSGKPVIWVCHALTANSDVADWWPGMVGKGLAFDPDQYIIVCANILGSCYGTTGPLSENPETGEPYYHDFPLITVRDLVKAHRLLADHLGVNKIDLITGGSLGGQQALEWAVQEPERFERLAPIATNARHSPWGIAFNETQRMAIESDATWQESHPSAGLEGLKAARAAAMLSYRHYETFSLTQDDGANRQLDDYLASSYLRHQGNKLAKRFNAFSYWTLSKAMDSHDVGRGRGSTQKALESIQADTLVLGMDSDILFPVQEQQYLAEAIPNARYEEISSVYGHDGFLIETERIGSMIHQFLHQPKTSIDSYE